MATRKLPAPSKHAGAPPAPIELSPGDVVGERWRIVRQIGEGGSAVIYEAVHRNGRVGALKVLRPILSNDARARERFLAEARIANEVGHPSIVSVFDDDVLEDGRPYLVLELLEGESLHDRLARLPDQKMDALEACELGVRLCDLLDAVHGRGVIHRDLKPDNLFLTNEGQLKLLDFGIARAETVSRVFPTMTGVVLGTLGYMAREQARGDLDSIDRRTDVWGVGALLYRVITGKRVHQSESSNAELFAAMETPPAKVRVLAPEVPERIARVIDKALEQTMACRWGSALEMRDALELAIRHERLMRTAPPSWPGLEEEIAPPTNAAEPRRLRVELKALAFVSGIALGMIAAASWFGLT
ncbi:MAG: serine/threonine protein kinase [Polyangiaceae bacterium]|nr:serine/threonine protein kinase [Polyangiaceae bacterium]